MSDHTTFGKCRGGRQLNPGKCPRRAGQKQLQSMNGILCKRSDRLGVKDGEDGYALLAEPGDDWILC